ncbi:MAG: ABC transporter substrate-binding protein, partial [Afipia sp.]
MKSAESNRVPSAVRRSGQSWAQNLRYATLIWAGLNATQLQAEPTAQRDRPAPVPAHGIAMHGTPALPANFAQMPYVNPDAPKGGRIIFGLLGAFDSLNPFIVKGIAVQQVRGYVTESL